MFPGTELRNLLSKWLEQLSAARHRFAAAALLKDGLGLVRTAPHELRNILPADADASATLAAAVDATVGFLRNHVIPAAGSQAERRIVSRSGNKVQITVSSPLEGGVPLEHLESALPADCPLEAPLRIGIMNPGRTGL